MPTSAVWCEHLFIFIHVVYQIKALATATLANTENASMIETVMSVTATKAIKEEIAAKGK